MAVADSHDGLIRVLRPGIVDTSVHLGEDSRQGLYGDTVLVDSVRVLYEIRLRKGVFQCHDHFLVHGGRVMDL